MARTAKPSCETIMQSVSMPALAFPSLDCELVRLEGSVEVYSEDRPYRCKATQQRSELKGMIAYPMSSPPYGPFKAHAALIRP